MTPRLEGKVAFITGAGTGIGRIASELFSAEGARVVVAEIDPASGAETQDRVRAAGGDALWVGTDVTDTESVRNAISRAVDRFGRLDVLYNNAGGSTPSDGPVTEAPEEEFWRAIKLDLFGTFLVCKYGIPCLIESGGGSVINTSSNVALMALRGRDCYTAAKGGVASMTRSMAAEYAQHGVRVNAIAPGATRTPRAAALAESNEHIDRMVRGSQLLGWCEPRDIANMALYLASDESRVTTGQVLSVDAGATI
ncbi:MAG: SDR family NAD(P)-dependent oxidoreductase [Immundisolibacterales bacterium]|nr:SDR family NAD(P)-dependent oxidoreductase [Immundisolibacterales bacterium]